MKARIEAAARAAGRDSATVTLLAVSKAHDASRVREAMRAGQRAFGENYLQEALTKMDGLPPLEWHLIGSLQSNKTRLAAERFAWVQTVDREKVAERLSAQRPAGMAPLNVLIQVNISAEQSKGGVAPDGVEKLAQRIAPLKNLRLRGLMAIPEPGAGRQRYRDVKSLFERLSAAFGCDTLSIGMSDDLELAVAEGATMVRVGSAIFGERNREKSAA